LVVWPANLDSTRSRGKGRKLPSSRAVRQPTIKEIFQAATTLGLSPEMAEKAASPKSHWEKLGNVTLKRSGSKAATLRSVGSEILRIRQKAAQPGPESKRDKR
jgi:signal recognition particle subunit SRP19